MGSDISEQTLAFATNHDIVLVDTCGYVFSTPQNGITIFSTGGARNALITSPQESETENL